MLTVYLPGGFETLFQELAQPGAWGAMSSAVERMVAAAAAYGREITGPHPRAILEIPRRPA